MQQPQDQTPPPKAKVDQKLDKRAEALRENLKKRKLQAKQRSPVTTKNPKE